MSKFNLTHVVVAGIALVFGLTIGQSRAANRRSEAQHQTAVAALAAFQADSLLLLEEGSGRTVTVLSTRVQGADGEHEFKKEESVVAPKAGDTKVTLKGTVGGRPVAIFGYVKPEDDGPRQFRERLKQAEQVTSTEGK